MADMVDRSGLILTDWADTMAKAQAQQYAQVQRQRESEQYARQQSVQQASDQAFQQYAKGDVTGAMNTAAAGGAQDMWGKLGDQQKAQVAAQATDIGTAAFNLGKLPKGQQRVDYFNSFVPTLRAHGMNPDEIAQYAHSGFLDNDDALNGYRDKAIGIKELYDTEQATLKGSQDHGYKMEEIGAGLTIAGDGALIRNGTGAVVRGPGLGPKLVEYKDENGATHLYPFAGQSGAAGGDASRVMNYEARGAGVAAVPDNVQTLGQFSDFASGLNRQGIKSSAAGTYQIVGATMRQYAPKVLGPDWKNQPFNAQTQDRVAQAIFEDNRGSAGALRNQWVSLSPADAERIRHLPWSEARQVIAAGESGGSVRGASMPGQAADINLGGGRTGPLWKDETTTVNGQNVAGQRNQQTGEFKPLGGAGKAAKPVDYDGQISNADNSLSTIDRALKHPGLNAAFGMPSLNPFDGNLFGKIIPGSPAADARALVETVKSQAFLAGIVQMKGQGALSDAEGAKISTAIANLSDNQSDSQIRENLGVIRSMVSSGRNKLVQLRKRGSGQSQASPQAQTRTVNGRTYVKVQGGWQAQ